MPVLNAFEKLHALLVSEDIFVWHFPAKREGPRFVYRLEGEARPQHWCDTLEQLVDAAYAEIDPLLKPIPSHWPEPPGMTSEDG